MGEKSRHNVTKENIKIIKQSEEKNIKNIKNK
jgi:hypothetical protein